MTARNEIFQYEAPEEPPKKIQVLDDEGQVVDEDLVPDLTDEEFVELYYYMRLTRTVDQRGVSLQRQGRSGTMASGYGQEANCATAYALEEEDWLIPCYREFGSMLTRGLDPKYMFLYWMGKEPGHELPEELNTLTIPTPIATHLPHAAGLGMASQILDMDDRAFLSHFGDGATSEGDFHEALNFAGSFDTPNIFVCDNNQYAISVPFERQTGSATIAQKATAYGFDGVFVDGMDPLAVYTVTKEALRRAKSPEEGESRQSLIELFMYRLGGHSTSDDPSKYRSEEELERWEQKDPLPRLETFLEETDRLDEQKKEEIEDRIEAEVDAAVEEAESLEQDPKSMFENVYHEMTPELERQYEELSELREKYGDDEFSVEWGF